METNSTLRNDKLTHEMFFHRHEFEHEIDRPIEAWKWMIQTRSLPDKEDWVRHEVYEAWRRCLEDYALPLGKYAHWHSICVNENLTQNLPAALKIRKIIEQFNCNFYTFFKDASVMMVLTDTEGHILYANGEQRIPDAFISQLYTKGANWSENKLGNNGLGTAMLMKKPVAFQGMEHFLSVLHPYTTVGCPILDEKGNCIATIGLISDNRERMSSLFAFLNLICVLVNTHFPLAQNIMAQERVLKQIHFKGIKDHTSSHLTISSDLELLVKKAVKLQHHKIPILVTGESGVGKDHFVQLLKNSGERRDAPLIAINCASIPHDLIESELFGYESGSFTGARSSGKAGKFMLADKGILFLDEIGDMSFDLQSTLLRVLETSEFTPVGGNKSIRVDVQVIAATNVNLQEAVEAGTFRRDLYYRLNGAQIHLLPLRERGDKNFIIQQILNREINSISPGDSINICDDVLALFDNHPWPGNIRQLINVIRTTLYTMTDKIIRINDLPYDFLLEINKKSKNKAIESINKSEFSEETMSLSEWELLGIKTALINCKGNISIAAKKLGITRATLYKKMNNFNISKERKDESWEINKKKLIFKN